MTTIATRTLLAPPGHDAIGQPRTWVWPLPRLDGMAPEIIEPARKHRRDDVELGYATRMWSPGLVPVFAAQDGVVTYAGSAPGGPMLCVDHPGGWSTQYAELQHLLTKPTDRFRRRRKERVRAGDVIGHARRSTLRIRFALSRLTDDGSAAIDPAASMSGWSMLPWFAESTPRVVTRAAV